MAALKMLVPRSAKVCREGQTLSVPVAELTYGDMVIVEAGDLVPADLRLIDTSQLRVDEAALTGESVPVEKHTASLTTVELPVGDRLNMAYKGTVVTYGRATGVVIAIGMATELGKIAGLLQKEEAVQTPLQKRLARFGQRLALAILAICLFVFVLGVLRGEPPRVPAAPRLGSGNPVPTAGLASPARDSLRPDHQMEGSGAGTSLILPRRGPSGRPAEATRCPSWYPSVAS